MCQILLQKPPVLSSSCQNYVSICKVASKKSPSSKHLAVSLFLEWQCSSLLLDHLSAILHLPSVLVLINSELRPSLDLTAHFEHCPSVQMRPGPDLKYLHQRLKHEKVGLCRIASNGYYSYWSIKELTCTKLSKIHSILFTLPHQSTWHGTWKLETAIMHNIFRRPCKPSCICSMTIRRKLESG